MYKSRQRLVLPIVVSIRDFASPHKHATNSNSN